MPLARRATLALLAAAALAGPAWAQEKPVVAVTAIVEHPALDAARDGIKEALAEAGFVDGQNLTFTYESAQGNPATAAQIARKLVGEAPDVIVPISTPSAQAVVGATKEIPVVFTAVTDPVGAKLVADLKHPGGNVTGMSDLSPIGKHLDLIREILPEAKTARRDLQSGRGQLADAGRPAARRRRRRAGSRSWRRRRPSRPTCCRRRRAWSARSTRSTCRPTTRW